MANTKSNTPGKKVTGKVILYGADWCMWCHKAKDFFKANKVSFEEKDVDDPKFAQECMEKSGQGGIPVILIDGHVIVGFDEPQIRALLHL